MSSTNHESLKVQDSRRGGFSVVLLRLVLAYGLGFVIFEGLEVTLGHEDEFDVGVNELLIPILTVPTLYSVFNNSQSDK